MNKTIILLETMNLTISVINNPTNRTQWAYFPARLDLLRLCCFLLLSPPLPRRRFARQERLQLQL